MSQLPHRRIIDLRSQDGLSGNKGGTDFDIKPLSQPFFGGGQHDYCYHNTYFIMMYTNALIN